MPATITLRQILVEMSERYGVGTVVPLTSSASGTTLTLNTAGNPELRGPISSKGIPIGTPVVITAENSGTGVTGDRTYVSDWNPSTGVITVSPAIDTDTDATEAIFYLNDVRDGDRVIEAVNRALQNRVGRWEYRPLTYVPDGDLQGTTITNYWTTDASGALAYATATTFPETTNDQVGQVGLNRVLQLTSTGATSATGNGIRVQLSEDQQSWYFWTAIRLVSGTGTAEFVVRDNTNSADITLTVQRGNDDNTLTTTTFGDFMVCEGTFQVPATCAEIAPRLTLSATTMVAQMAPVIMFPQNAMAFPLPNRIESDNQIGNFFCAQTHRSPGGFYDTSFSEPITTSGLEHRILNYGDHRTVLFNFTVNDPVWYEEDVYGTALTSMSDTTTFPLEQVVLWSYFELTDRLMRDEMVRAAKLQNGQPSPSVWRPLRNAALKSAQRNSYEPATKHVVGRR